MNPKAEKAQSPSEAEANASAAERYVSALKADYGRYARLGEETRRLVDESMGATSLTELLYKSREDGAK